MAQYRKGRIAEEMRREISDIIRLELKDPRLGFVTIVKVDVAGDLKTAKVYVSHLSSDAEGAESLAALKSAAGFIRRLLATRLQTRTVPELLFIADDSIEHGMKISKLIADCTLDDEMKHVPDELDNE